MFLFLNCYLFLNVTLSLNSKEILNSSSFLCFYKGMMHLMDHEKVNEELLKLMETEGLDVQLSYDGLRVPVML